VLQYTRYRRWTRIAVLTETVEEVGPGPLGVERPDPPSAPPSPTVGRASVAAASPTAEHGANLLRNRLKLAVKG
jgi:hypothetical protein